MSDFVSLNDRVTIFDNQYPFSIVFIDFIVVDSGIGHFLNPYASLAVETNHMVVYDDAVVVLAVNQDSIQPIAGYSHIFADYRPAKISLVRAASYAISFALLDFVQGDVRKSTVDLNPFLILNDYVA